MANRTAPPIVTPPELTARPGKLMEAAERKQGGGKSIHVAGTEEQNWGQEPEPGNPTAELHPGELDHRRMREQMLQPAALLPHTIRRHTRQGGRVE
jgi:hypothetical protein